MNSQPTICLRLTLDDARKLRSVVSAHRIGAKGSEAEFCDAVVTALYEAVLEAMHKPLKALPSQAA